MNNPYLNPIFKKADLLTEEVRATFGFLSKEQLNWKPSPQKWSIGQCLDHIITSNQQYEPIFKAFVNGTHKKTFWERLPFLPSMFGKMLMNSLKPNAKMKMKAPSVFRPAQRIYRQIL